MGILDNKPTNLRAQLEDDFSLWLAGNFRNEQDQDFFDELMLEYPWLFADILEYDEDDRKWVRYEFNCYVNSIYDPIRRI